MQLLITIENHSTSWEQNIETAKLHIQVFAERSHVSEECSDDFRCILRLLNGLPNSEQDTLLLLVPYLKYN